MSKPKALQLGDLIQAKIIEVVSRQIFVVEVDGNLMRVRNASRKTLRLGDSVQLVVRSVSPLELRLLEKDPEGTEENDSVGKFERFA